MTAHAVFFNDTGRDLKVHAASSVPVEIIPKWHQVCIEVLDGRYAFFKVWGDTVILITTCAEPVCPPPPLPKPAKGSCFLCERPRRRVNWFYEDNDLWILECPYCKDILVAPKAHALDQETSLLLAVRRGLKRYPDHRIVSTRKCFPGSHPYVHLHEEIGAGV